MGQRDIFYLNGTDYDTPDGTCIRDYVHLIDIARAHILALGVIDHIKARIYNIGNGKCYSNLEVIEAVRKVKGRDIRVVNKPKRPGDPSILVASSETIQEELGWSLKYPELETMIKSAWNWRKKHPRGYKK